MLLHNPIKPAHDKTVLLDWMQHAGHAATYLLNVLLHQLQSNKQNPPTFAHLCCFWCKTYCTYVPNIIEVLSIATQIKNTEDEEVRRIYQSDLIESKLTN